MLTDAQQSLLDRLEGRARSGVVGIREFDRGVVETMGAEVFNSNYFIKGIVNAPFPAEFPGVPVTFYVPDDILEEFKIPVVIVNRTDIEPDMARWHPGLVQWRAPAEGALPVTLADGRTGWTEFEQVQQATPFNLQYTIMVMARNRGGRFEMGTRSQANSVFHEIQKIYPPYCVVRVHETIENNQRGDERFYEAFGEGYSSIDEIIEVTERTIGFQITLRVSAELDLGNPTIRKAVLSNPDIRTSFANG